MVHGTLYDQLGVPPTAPPQELAATIEARLAGATEEERETLRLARATLLDPDSRESYDRLHGLRGPLSPQEGAALLAGQREALAASERRLAETSVWAEVWFTLYLTLVALIICVWLLSLRLLVPALLDEAIFFIEMTGWPLPPAWLSGMVLTVPFAMLAFLALYIFDRATQMAARMAMLLVLVGAALLLGIQTISRTQLVAGTGVLGAFLLLFPLSLAIMRWIGQQDLDSMLPGSRRRR